MSGPSTDKLQGPRILRAGQFRCIVGGKQDVERLAFCFTPGLDSFRLSGYVPEPGLADHEALAAATGRSIIDDAVIDLQPLNRRQQSRAVRHLSTSIPESVVVGVIRAFFNVEISHR